MQTRNTIKKLWQLAAEAYKSIAADITPAEDFKNGYEYAKSMIENNLPEHAIKYLEADLQVNANNGQKSPFDNGIRKAINEYQAKA